MGRLPEIDPDTLARVFYASQFAVLLLALAFVAYPFDTAADYLLAVLIAALALALAVGIWRLNRADAEPTHLGTAEDITYDPIAAPGQAAKHRWRMAIDRLPGGDDGDD